MQTILVVVHLFLAIGIVTLVLLQHGKGADAGAAFGSGASATVFGARGSTSFLSRATGVLASLFFITSMALAYYATQSARPEGLMDRLPPAAQGSPGMPDQVKGGSEVPVPPPAAGSDVPVLPPAAAEAGGIRGKAPGTGDAAAHPLARALPKAPEGISSVPAPSKNGPAHADDVPHIASAPAPSEVQPPAAGPAPSGRAVEAARVHTQGPSSPPAGVAAPGVATPTPVLTPGSGTAPAQAPYKPGG
jgi:preprotein translocase subunit SecG